MKITQVYLKKRGITGPWEIDPPPEKTYQQAVVIPAYAELKMLPQTLQSLDNNNPTLLKDTLVIIIVNHGKTSHAEIKENNQSTLQMLYHQKNRFTLGVVNAASQGLELAAKQSGVGVARKIGMDLVLPYLSDPKSLI